MITKLHNIWMKNVEADTKMRSSIASDASDGIVGEIK